MPHSLINATTTTTIGYPAYNMVPIALHVPITLELIIPLLRSLTLHCHEHHDHDHGLGEEEGEEEDNQNEAGGGSSNGECVIFQCSLMTHHI